MRKIVQLAVTTLLFAPFSVQATLVFSDIEIEENSVTFTVDGDMSGYAAPPTSWFQRQFSIMYFGDLWASSNNVFQPNSWSASVFDNHSLSQHGNTGRSGDYYSWSVYSGNLANAVANNRRITVTLSTPRLNPDALNGYLQFVWGNGSRSRGPSVLQTVRSWNETDEATVPEPGTLALFGLGLAGVGFARRRNR